MGLQVHLTGSPQNRESAALMQDRDCKGYLFMLDIDDFKTVNDTMDMPSETLH